jgi:uncharacterized protein
MGWQAGASLPPSEKPGDPIARSARRSRDNRRYPRAVLNHQIAWYIGGPILGLCVVAVRALFGERLGVTGSFAEVVERVSDRSFAFGWRAWFLVGLVAGAIAFTLIAGGPDFHGYGWLTDTFTGGWKFMVGVVLLASGVLIAFGARTAGGCTAGNGLSGSAMASPASFVATAVFFATAIGVSFLTKALF